LQHFIASSQQQMGEAWLDIYLTSPIWRFVFTPGVIDQHAWAGILMPSVDRVGRYFPFTVLNKLPAMDNPLQFLAQQTAWYEQVEDVALAALDGELMADDLMQQITAIEWATDGNYGRNTAVGERVAQVVDMTSADDSPASTYGFLLDALLTRSCASYSAWNTQGSERVAPCVFTVQGLPAIDSLPAMLDGQWQQWHWQQPYVLRNR
jgi:type VI secretion system protein ImpM